MVELAHCALRAAEAAVKLGDSRVACDGSADEVDGLGMPLQLMLQHAEQMQRISIVWSLSQRLTIQRSGCIEATGMMMLGRRCDELFDVGHTNNLECSIWKSKATVIRTVAVAFD